MVKYKVHTYKSGEFSVSFSMEANITTQDEKKLAGIIQFLYENNQLIDFEETPSELDMVVEFTEDRFKPILIRGVAKQTKQGDSDNK